MARKRKSRCLARRGLEIYKEKEDKRREEAKGYGKDMGHGGYGGCEGA